MTKIDVFMYDLSTIIEEWRNLPLGRDTPKYYEKIINYVGKDIIAEIIEDLKNKDYYWKVYRSNLIKKWEAKAK